MQSQLGLGADLQGVTLGEEAQLGGVFLIGNFDLALGGDCLLEPILAGHAQDVRAALLQGKTHGTFAGLFVGGHLVLLYGGFLNALAGLRCPRHGAQDGVGLCNLALQDKERELLAGRFARGCLGGEGNIKGLTGKRQRLTGLEAGGESFARKEHIVHAAHVLAVDDHGEAQAGAGLAAGGVVLHLKLARGIGSADEMPAIGQVIAHLLVSHRLAPVVLGLDGQLDRFAPKINRSVGLQLESDFFQLKTLHGEGAGVGLLGLLLLAGGQGVAAQWRARIELQARVEGAEFPELLLGLPNQAPGGVLDGHQVHLALRRDECAVLHIADDAAQLDGLAGLIRGPVSIEIALGRQTGAKFQPAQADDVGGHVALGDGEHAQAVDGLEFLKFFAEHAVLFGGAGAKDLFAVTEQHLHAGGRLAGPAVLHEHQRLAPGGLEDEVQVTADHQRGGFKVFIAHVDQAHAGLGARKGHLDVLHARPVVGVVLHLHLPRLVRLNKRDVEMVDAANRVRLAEVRLQVEEVLLHRHLLDVARAQLHHRLFVCAKDALGLQRERGLGHQAHARTGVAGLAAPLEAAIRLERGLPVAKFLLLDQPDAIERHGTFLRVGILADQPLPLINALLEGGFHGLIGWLGVGGRPGIVLFLLQVHRVLVRNLAEEKENAARAVVERVGREKGVKKLAGLRVVLGLHRIHRHLVLRVDHAALAVGPLRAIGVLVDVALPRLGGLLVFLLAVTNLGHVEKRLLFPAALQLGGRAAHSGNDRGKCVTLRQLVVFFRDKIVVT